VESTALHAATIHGVVKDPGGFSADRSAVWAVTEDCRASHRAIADKQGHYSLEGLPSGIYKVFATQPGFWHIGERTVRVGNDTTANVDLQLVISDVDTGGSPPSMPLNGIITDVGGQPISGARITHSSRGLYSPNEVTSSEDGSFGFCRVSGERVEFRVEHQGYKPHTIELKLRNSHDVDHAVKIELRKN
jgi:Carboxypeptidase regulatory-like domain